MELTETHTLPVSQQRTWDALNDTEVLRACIPGCESIDPDGENAYLVALSEERGQSKSETNWGSASGHAVTVTPAPRSSRDPPSSSHTSLHTRTSVPTRTSSHPIPGGSSVHWSRATR